MSDLRRRLRKLELVWTDTSGFVPHSPAWLEYWTRELEEVLERRESELKKPIPLEVVRAYLQAQPNTDSRYDDEA